MFRKEISFEENKKLQLDILRNFISFCDRYELKYYIAYGSLIGAIRHKGFIPWDDDIDVEMPRKDYAKLIELYNRFNNDDIYYLVSPYDEIAKHPYVKLIDKRTIKVENGIRYNNDYLGVDIDIFPIDGQPEEKSAFDEEYNKLIIEYKKWYYLLSDDSGETPIKRLLLPIYRLFLGQKKTVIKKIDSVLKSNDFEESKYVGDLSNLYSFSNDRHLRDDYGDGVLVCFEDLMVKAPVGYDRILRKQYGDYMQLPPSEEQVTHHGYKAYWR